MGSNRKKIGVAEGVVVKSEKKSYFAGSITFNLCFSGIWVECLSNNGAQVSTSTKAFESIRRCQMTATKVAHVKSATAFLSLKLSRQCVCFVKRPVSTCRHTLWGAELPPPEVKVGHRGGIRGICWFKLEDRKVKSIDFLVRKFAVVVEAVWNVCKAAAGGTEEPYKKRAARILNGHK